MIKKIVIGLLALGLIGGIYGYFQFNKEHRDIAGEEASVKINSTDLFQAYVNDEVKANALYLDKVLEVSGKITEVSTERGAEMIVLQTNDDFGGVDVYFIDSLAVNSIKIGNEIIVKGYCAGGDDLGIKMIKCSIIKQK